jgi:hypothetical protein
MGYYIRFIDQCAQPAKLSDIKEAMVAYDAQYTMEDDVLRYRGEPCAQITINVPGDGHFEDDIGQLLEGLEDMEGKVKQVAKVLRSAKSIIAVQVLFGGRDADEVLDALQPIWDYCDKHLDGLLYADDEGFYKMGRLIASE